MIPLNNKVPYTRIENPTSCENLKVSQPIIRLINQIPTVREVSIVDLEVAEIRRVTARPVILNVANMNIMTTEEIKSGLMVNACENPS